MYGEKLNFPAFPSPHVSPNAKKLPVNNVVTFLLEFSAKKKPNRHVSSPHSFYFTQVNLTKVISNYTYCFISWFMLFIKLIMYDANIFNSILYSSHLMDVLYIHIQYYLIGLMLMGI